MRHKHKENAFPRSGRRDGVPTAVSSNGSKSKILRLLYHKSAIIIEKDTVRHRHR